MSQTRCWCDAHTGGCGYVAYESLGSICQLCRDYCPEPSAKAALGLLASAAAFIDRARGYVL